MSSEQLADGVNPLDAELAATWDVLKGYSGRDTDLGIARRFGGAAAAYSLRNIGSDGLPVVNVRRDVAGEESDAEEKFSAHQISSGALEDWVNGKLERTLPADVTTAAAAYSLRRVSSSASIYTGDYSSGTDSIFNPASGSAVTVTGNNDGISDGSTSKDNVLKIENNTTVCPQLALLKGSYIRTKSGRVTFTYYVPTGHPIIGKYWHIGSMDAGAASGTLGARIYSPIGKQIVGGTWTTTTVEYGNEYGGLDKVINDFGNAFITIANDEDPITSPFVEATADDGDFYYISAISITALPEVPIRIRRVSDNTEVNVSFDSDSKVSLSSDVTNIAEEGGESAQTNATDFSGFLNESVTGFTAIPYLLIASIYKNFTSDPTVSNTAFSGANGGTASRLCYVNTLNSNLTAREFDGCKVKVTGTVNTLSGGALTIKPSRDADGGNTWTPSEGNKVISDGTTGAFEYTFTGNGTDEFRSVVFIIDASTTVNVSNLTFEYIQSSAFVHSWYDQAGSNDAIQTTDANQPMIAENGAVLADGIDFDGSDDFLQTSSGVSITSSSDLSFSTVYKSDVTSTAQSVLSQEDGTGTGRLWLGLRSNDDIASFIGGSEKVLFSGGSSTNETLTSIIFDDSASTLDGFKNSSTGTQGTSVNMEASDGKVNIGEGTSSNERFNGTMKEIIIYLSDQTDNRFKIESNINNYYSLYTFQGNGFVETWYDQSGSGNDATQTTASKQPKIVNNGSIIKNVKGFPSLNFESSAGNDFDIGKLIDNINSASAYVVHQNDAGNTNRVAGFTQGTSGNDSRFYLTFYSNNGTIPHFGYNDSATKISFGVTSTGTTNMYSAFCGDTNVEAFKNGTSVGTTALVDVANTTTNSKIGAIGASFFFDGKISEIFITTKKLQDDAATINSNVTSYYNL